MNKRYKFVYSKKSAFKTPSATTYLVTSPDKAAKFSLKANEFELAELFDGERSDEEICELYLEQAGIELDSLELDEFIDRLSTVHLLQSIKDTLEVTPEEEPHIVETEEIRAPKPVNEAPNKPKTSQTELSTLFPELFGVEPENQQEAVAASPVKPTAPTSTREEREKERQRRRQQRLQGNKPKQSKPKVQVMEISDIEPIEAVEDVDDIEAESYAPTESVGYEHDNFSESAQGFDDMSDGMPGMSGMSGGGFGDDMGFGGVLEGEVERPQRRKVEARRQKVEPRSRAVPNKQQDHGPKIVVPLPGFFSFLSRPLLLPQQFGKIGVIITTFMVLFLLYAIWTDWLEFMKDIKDNFAGHSIVFNLILSMFTVNLFSQLARFSVLKEYTGKAPPFGIILVLKVLPRFYTDMSGSLKALKEPHQREAVIASTLSATISIFILACVGWMMTHDSTKALAFLCSGVATMSAIIFVMHLNPLGLNEGYFLLALKVGALDLREQAVKTFLGKQKKPSNISATVLGLYGMLIIVFTIGAIVFITTFAAQWLTDNAGGTGAVIFCVIVGIAIKNILELAKEKQEKEKASNKPGMAMMQALQNKRGQNLPAQGQGFQSPFASEASPRKKRPTIKQQARKRQVFYYVKWVAFLGVLGFLGIQPYTYEPGGDVVLKAHKQMSVVAQIPAVIREIYVTEGDYVEKGKLLARLSAEEEEKNVAISRSRIRELQAKLQITKNGATAEQIAVDKSRVATARTQYNYSKKEADRLYKLYKRRIIPQSQYDAAKAKAEVDHDQLTTTQLDLERLLNQTSDEEIEVMKAEIAKEEANLRYQLNQLKYSELRAPMAGKVISSDVVYAAGQFLNQGGVFVIIEDSSELIAAIELPETEIEEIRVGNDVRIRLLANTNEQIYGTVDNIATTATESEYGRRTILVTTRIDNESGELKSGSSGFAKITSETRPAAIVFTRMLVRFVKYHIWTLFV